MDHRGAPGQGGQVDVGELRQIQVKPQKSWKKCGKWKIVNKCVKCGNLPVRWKKNGESTSFFWVANGKNMWKIHENTQFRTVENRVRIFDSYRLVHDPQ